MKIVLLIAFCFIADGLLSWIGDKVWDIESK